MRRSRGWCRMGGEKVGCFSDGWIGIVICWQIQQFSCTVAAAHMAIRARKGLVRSGWPTQEFGYIPSFVAVLGRQGPTIQSQFKNQSKSI
jgi:hypothetical protein